MEKISHPSTHPDNHKGLIAVNFPIKWSMSVTDEVSKTSCNATLDLLHSQNLTHVRLFYLRPPPTTFNKHSNSQVGTELSISKRFRVGCGQGRRANGKGESQSIVECLGKRGVICVWKPNMREKKVCYFGYNDNTFM